MSLDPALVPDTLDPGDDVQRRFRYQSTYAGILGLLMTDETQGVDELYCEHHDDILLKFNDDKYQAIQVKTRELTQHPFDIEDEAIKKSCKRFVAMSKQFPDKFKGFSIVSNHGFDNTADATCIQKMIDYFKNGGVYNARTKQGSFIKFIADECGCTIDEVIDVIKKMRLTTYSSIDDIDFKLKNKIKSCSLLDGITESKVSEIADMMLAKFFKASSLIQGENDLLVSYIAGTVGAEALELEKINQKRIDKKNFCNWLGEFKAQPVKLRLKDRALIEDVPHGNQILAIKMDAGNIDSDNINMMRDLKYSFEQHATAWLYKDSASANEQYKQVSIIMENLCKEVYDENNIANNDDGQDMLIKVRRALKERHRENPELFFDCTYEHLLGAVGVLTEACKVWWSQKFKLPE